MSEILVNIQDWTPSWTVPAITVATTWHRNIVLSNEDQTRAMPFKKKVTYRGGIFM